MRETNIKIIYLSPNPGRRAPGKEETNELIVNLLEDINKSKYFKITSYSTVKPYCSKLVFSKL